MIKRNGHTVKLLRWDHGDLSSYYSYTGDGLSTLLNNIDDMLNQYHGTDDVDVRSLYKCIDYIYCYIVSVLQSGADMYIPKREKSFYKHWWDEELKLLKEASIDSNNIWKAAGKPRQGHIFSNRQFHRLQYRKCIKENQKLETNIYTNKLY